MKVMLLFNNQFIERTHISIDPEDRAYQFGDGVYEVIRVYDSKAFLLKEHLERLQRSAQAIRLTLPYSIEQIEEKLVELVKKNQLEHGNIYIQVSRGVAPRNHAFPKSAQPVLVAYTQNSPRPLKELTEGVSAITTEDIRWLRCDIKSLNLLGAVLAKQEALDNNSFESILIRNGIVTEGSSTNIFVVKNNQLYTHPANHLILHGITRKVTIELARELQIPVHETPFDRAFLLSSDEVFLTSTTMEICPIIKVDDYVIGSGKPGHITKQLQEKFEKRIKSL